MLQQRSPLESEVPETSFGSSLGGSFSPAFGLGGSNQAIADGLGAPGAAGDVSALHSTPDHLGLGGDLPVTVGEHELTTGELNALADYVAAPGDLADLTPEQLERARELMNKEPLTAAEAAEISAIFPAYEDLSFDNGNHFGASDPEICAPSGGDGPTNQSATLSWLGQAVDKAAEAGRAAARGEDGSVGLDEALAMAAFGGHFIADAFSSGHLFNKADVMAQTQAGLDEAGPEAVSGMLGQASMRIYNEGIDTLSHWFTLVHGVPMPVGFAHLRALLEVVLSAEPEVFKNSMVLAVHDELSLDGVWVTDGEALWQMFGDHSLDAVSEGKAKALIDEGMNMVFAAFTQPDSCQPVDSLLSRFPVPVGSEKERIAATIERATTVEGGGMEDALVASSVAMLDQILAGANDATGGLPLFVRVGGEAGHGHGHGEGTEGGLVEAVQPITGPAVAEV